VSAKKDPAIGTWYAEASAWPAIGDTGPLSLRPGAVAVAHPCATHAGFLYLIFPYLIFPYLIFLYPIFPYP
jgi:hypothetical protein